MMNQKREIFFIERKRHGDDRCIVPSSSSSPRQDIFHVPVLCFDADDRRYRRCAVHYTSEYEAVGGVRDRYCSGHQSSVSSYDVVMHVFDIVKESSCKRGMYDHHVSVWC